MDLMRSGLSIPVGSGARAELLVVNRLAVHRAAV
jgi:hypothetical protein